MPRYIKPDSEKGYLDDYVEIQAQKFNNLRHVEFDNMLGDFDDQGLYFVNPDIVKELVEMPKYVVEIMDNLEICLSTLKLDKQISFLIAYEGEKVTLSLLEKVNFEANSKLGIGSWSNVNEYVLDSIETSGEIDRQALYLRWNVQTFPGEVVDIFNCEDSVLAKYFNIVNRFKENMEAKTILLEQEEKLEEDEAEYFLDIMEILKDYPKLNKIVKEEIKQTLNGKKDFVKFDKLNFVKTLNEVIEKAIESNIKVLPQNQIDNFAIEKRNVTLKKNIKDYDVIQISTDKIDKANERIENLDNLNVIENQDSCSVIKIKTEDVKFKSIKESADKLAKAEKSASNKKKERIISLFMGKADSDKQNKGDNNSDLNNKLIEIYKIIKASGVEESAIISAPVLEEVKKGKEGTQTKTNEADKSKAAESSKGDSSAVKKPETKKETKKPVKKPAKKPAKKEAKKETKKDDKGAKKDSDKKVEKAEATDKKAPSTTNYGGLISGRISGRIGNIDKNKNKENEKTSDLDVSADRLRYVSGAESNIRANTVVETQKENKTNLILDSQAHIIENKQKELVSKTEVAVKTKVDSNEMLEKTKVYVSGRKLNNTVVSNKNFDDNNMSL